MQPLKPATIDYFRYLATRLEKEIITIKKIEDEEIEARGIAFPSRYDEPLENIVEVGQCFRDALETIANITNGRDD